MIILGVIAGGGGSVALVVAYRKQKVNEQSGLFAIVGSARDLALMIYAELLAVAPSPVVALNHAVAVAVAAGPDEGLALIDRIDGLDRYHLLHAARADLLRRLGRTAAAADGYRRAHELATNPADRRFLARRLHDLDMKETR